MTTKRMIGLVIVFVLTGSRDLLACDCYPQSVPERFYGSSVIFTGKVVEIVPSGDARGFQALDAKIGVAKAYKGVNAAEITVRTGSGTCRVLFEKGQEFLVYARLEGETLVTNTCEGTVPLIAASRDLEELDKIAATAPLKQ